MDALRVGGKCWNDLVYTMGNHEKENKFISTPVVRDRGNLRKIDKSNCIVANYWKGMDNHGIRTMVHEERFTPIHIPEATKKGYAEIFPGECFDGTQLGSKTRRGRKMTGKCNCLMAQAIPEYYRYEKRPIQLNPSTESNGNQPYQQNRVYSEKV